MGDGSRDEGVVVVTSISDIFSRLAEQNALDGVFDGLEDRNSHLRALVRSLRSLGKRDEALELTETVLAADPSNLDFLMLSLDIMSEKGDLERIFSRIRFMKGIGVDSALVTEEIKRQLNVAVEIHAKALADLELEKALEISEHLVSFYPEIAFFREALQQDRWRLRQKHLNKAQEYEGQHYNSLTEQAEAYRASGDLEGEIAQRLEVYRHPHDQTRHSALRLQNLMLLISRLLAAEKSEITPENVSLVKTLQAEALALPSTPVIDAGFDEDPAACFDRFYRQVLSFMDLDTVFGSGVDTTELLPAYYMTSKGEPLDLDGLVARSKEVGAKVVYTTSTSAEYFERYAQSYISSHLKSDLPCMVIVYVCAPKEKLPGLVASLGMDDPRLIFCSDGFDPDGRDIDLISPNHGAPIKVHGIYYAVSCLFRADYCLKYLGLPVFAMGIDTILQRGVADLFEQYADRDLVLNMAGSNFTVGSQLVNNLVLVMPTENGLRFVNFMKRFLGEHLDHIVQPAFLDQMDLHMAKMHMQHAYPETKFGYFDEFDINNVMFNKDNIQGHMERVLKYRFLNMFIGGNPKNAMSSEDIGEDAAPAEGQAEPVE